MSASAMLKSAATCACFLAALIGLFGCTSPQRAPVDAALFAKLETLPADGVVAADDLYPDQTQARTYLVVAGEQVGENVQRTLQATEEHQAAWASHEGEARTEYWSVDDDGAVHLHAVYEAGDAAVTHFDPPLSWPAALPPGEAHREESAMRVVDAADPTVQKASGKATRTLEYLDNQQIRTPRGTMIAQRVSVHFTAELGVATAETTSMYYVVPGVGVVAEESSERVRILGMFDRESDRTVVLVDSE